MIGERRGGEERGKGLVRRHFGGGGNRLRVRAETMGR